VDRLARTVGAEQVRLVMDSGQSSQRRATEPQARLVHPSAGENRAQNPLALLSLSRLGVWTKVRLDKLHYRDTEINSYGTNELRTARLEREF